MRRLRVGVARVWQRSVFAQTSLVLCGTLLAAQVIAFVLFCGKSPSALREAAKAGFADTLHLSAAALPALAPGSADRFLWLSETLPDNAWPEAAPAELLSRLEHEPSRLSWFVGTAHAGLPGEGDRAGKLDWKSRKAYGVQLASHPSRAGYVASLELDDGTRLNGLFATPAWTHPLASQNWTLHGVTLTLMMLASVLLSRRLTEPMRRFARAADQVGRGQHAVLPKCGCGEVRRTAEAMEAMQERVLALVEDRTHLLSAIGHDLRTPLTSARLRAHLVEEQALKARLLGDLDRVEQIAESALDVVRGLAEEPTARVDLRALIGEIARDLRDAGADVSFVASGARVENVTCRTVMLRRAVTNLVDNAVKYGDRAELSLRRDGPGEVSIEVRDFGDGIDEARFEEAFKPFRRLEGSRSRATGGTGLGLTLARSVARRHGGDVSLARAVDGPGLVATLRLPDG